MTTMIDINKLVYLRSRREEVGLALATASERRRETRAEVVRLQGLVAEQDRATWRVVERRELDDAGREFVTREIEQGAPAALRGELARAADADRAAAAHVDRLRRELEPLGALVGRLEDFARQHGVDLERLPVFAAPPRPHVSATPAELAEVREVVTGLKQERRSLDRQAASHDEVRAAIDRALDDAAARVRFPVPFRGTAAPFELLLNEDGPATRITNARLIEGLVALVGGDALRAAWYAQADAEIAGRGGYGMDRSQKAARIGDLDRRLFEAENREEALVVALEASGLSVGRRADADPAAVLALHEPPADSGDTEHTEPAPRPVVRSRSRSARSRYLETGGETHARAGVA